MPNMVQLLPYRMQFWSPLALLVVILLVNITKSSSPTLEVHRTTSLNKFLGIIFQTEQLFLGCTLQLFWSENVLKPSQGAEGSWRNRLANLIAFSHVQLNNNGLTLFQMGNQSLSQHNYKQPKQIVHTRRCSVVLILLDIDDKHEYTEEEESMLWSALTEPHLVPPTLRNRDKYLLLTSELTSMRIFKSQAVQGLKYKLFLIPSNNTCPTITGETMELEACSDFMVSLSQSCQYGLCKEGGPFLLPVSFNPLNMELLEPPDLFPDLEKNFFGKTLRLSTTTKVPQLLEMDIVKDENNKDVYLPKRGVYATVLKELSGRLNFTYEIVPSSGKGSTGHALANGTWVGIVGDTFRGVVDFGFMAAITYGRFPYAELCAPINFAYMGFVTGPPRKDFRWQAIFWPFNPVVWANLVITILIASKLPSIISRYSFTLDVIPPSPTSRWRLWASSLWTYLKDMAFLIRGLLEQCDELPPKMSPSYMMFITLWLLFCLVMSTAYRSKMVSLLTFPVFDRIPTTFDELAVAKDFKIDFHYFGNVGYTYFETSTNPSFVKIFTRMGKEPSALKCLERTLAEKSSCITFIDTFRELLYRNLSDQYGKSPLKFTPHRGALFPAGVIHAYNAPLSENFQRVLFPAMESALISKFQQDDFNQVLNDKNKWEKASNVNAVKWSSELNGAGDSLLRVRNLHGAFIIFGIGLVAAAVAFLGESTKGYQTSSSTRIVSRFAVNCI